MNNINETPLLKLIYENGDNLLSEVRNYIESGADPNERTKYNETPLNVSSRNGRFDVVKLLIELGADHEHLKWTELFHAIAYGSIAEVEKLLDDKFDITALDHWERTPFLLAIQAGNIEKLKLLLNAGADLNDKGRCGMLVLEYAIRSDDDKMLKCLVELGCNIEEYNEFGSTPLMEASKYGAVKCVKALIDLGADIFKKDRGQFSRKTAIAETYRADIALLLAKAGDDLSDINPHPPVKLEVFGIDKQEKINIEKQEYLEQKHRVFGTSNPELCKKKFWYEMVRTSAGAWKARDQFNDTRHDDPPVWCYERYGQTITDLGNGEYIEIAGEHEDYYDPDFCIYNEVFHHRGNGEFDIYMYPKEVFPPTDFHSATLVDEFIYIIGNLGYRGERLYGTTPVYRLNIKTFEIEKIDTKGEMPGWIRKHKAYYDGKSVIRIKGGVIECNSDQKQFNSVNDYELCLKTFTWTRHEHVSMTKEAAFFPEDYKQFRHSEGMLLGGESNGKWSLIKILKVHRVDVYKGQTILIADHEITSPVDDFLFVVACSFSNEYESIEALEQAVKDNTWTTRIGCVPRRTTGFSDDYSYLGREDASKDELKGFKIWRDAFEKGEAGIF